MVTAALRNLATVKGRLAVCGITRVKPVSLSIGATPKQTSIDYGEYGKEGRFVPNYKDVPDTHLLSNILGVMCVKANYTAFSAN
jgi:hypothetical protein